MMYVIMRGQWIATANRAAASSWVSEALKVALSFRNLHVEIDHGWPDLKSGKQVVGGARAGFDGRVKHDVRTGKTYFRR